MKHFDTGEHVQAKPTRAHMGHEHFHDVHASEPAVNDDDPARHHPHALTSHERNFLVNLLTERLGARRKGEMKREEELLRTLIEKFQSVG